MELMLGPALFFAFISSLISTRRAVHKRVRGELTPSLNSQPHWLKPSLLWNLFLAAISIVVVFGISSLIPQFTSVTRLSRIGACMIAALVAAPLGYIYSSSAIMRTLLLDRRD